MYHANYDSGVLFKIKQKHLLQHHENLLLTIIINNNQNLLFNLN